MKQKYHQKICIVTPGYISSTPRVVKEADALWKAGFKVKVVFSQGNLERIREYDEKLLKEKPWDWATVGWSPFRKEEIWLYRKTGLRHYLFRSLPSIFSSFGKLAEFGEGRIYQELAHLAAQEKADIYIGHYPTGLAAAAYAASRWGSRLGYDIEDLHTGEQPLTKTGIRHTKRIGIIEKRYLKDCSHITAVSELIADEIVNRYHIPRPVVIHNTFSWADRNKLDGQIKDRNGSSLSLYWYSQVIGEGRGIEDVIKAASLLKEKVQIHLRGNISLEIKHKFQALACDFGVEEQLYFHLPVPPTELLSRAVEHDVGLALEQPVSVNKLLTVSNKLFFYLLAGLAIAATDVPGQKYVLSTCANAGFVYAPGDHQSLASELNKLLADPNHLQLCKQAAIAAASEQWNWEMESQKVVNNLERILLGV